MCAVSFLTACAFALFAPADTPSWIKVVAGVAVTTIAWVTAMYLTHPDDERTLREFCKKVNPGGLGWRRVLERAAAEGDPIEASTTHVPLALTCILAGCLSIYGTLFATGFFLYEDNVKGTVLTIGTLIASVFLWRSWMRISAD